MFKVLSSATSISSLRRVMATPMPISLMRDLLVTHDFSNLFVLCDQPDSFMQYLNNQPKGMTSTFYIHFPKLILAGSIVSLGWPISGEGENRLKSSVCESEILGFSRLNF